MVADRFADLREGRSIAGQAALIPSAGADAGDLGQLASVYILVGAHGHFRLKETPGHAGNDQRMSALNRR